MDRQLIETDAFAIGELVDPFPLFAGQADGHLHRVSLRPGAKRSNPLPLPFA
jgi:hypothetical protein